MWSHTIYDFYCQFRTFIFSFPHSPQISLGDIESVCAREKDIGKDILQRGNDMRARFSKIKKFIFFFRKKQKRRAKKRINLATSNKFCGISHLTPNHTLTLLILLEKHEDSNRQLFVCVLGSFFLDKFRNFIEGASWNGFYCTQNANTQLAVCK